MLFKSRHSGTVRHFNFLWKIEGQLQYNSRYVTDITHVQISFLITFNKEALPWPPKNLGFTCYTLQNMSVLHTKMFVPIQYKQYNIMTSKKLMVKPVLYACTYIVF